tara:strand:- start:760 stop:1224 length:465 start_codon:yes stop_codon:yes gene_type:complete
MKNIILIISIILLNTNCSINNVVKHHGVPFLEKKQKEIVILNTNKNDVKLTLGPPSTKSTFDNDVWIYMERKTTVSKLRSLGRQKLLTNNVLVLEFDNKGILIKKKFYDKNEMNKIKISKKETAVLNKKNSFINNVLVTLRQKINDPLGKKTAK